jgi:hypothetical protein
MKQLFTFLFILLLYGNWILPTKAIALPATEPATGDSTHKSITASEQGMKDLATVKDESSTKNSETADKATAGIQTENSTANVPQVRKSVSERVQSSESEVKTVGAEKSLIKDNQIILYYGFPGVKEMGILGEHSVEELAVRLKKLAAEYDNLNGDKGVIPAFHLIFGTVWPKGEIGIIQNTKLQKYIDFAEQNGFLVFIDHQLGKYSVEYAVNLLLPYLKYKSVHLAIDPEWHTLTPGEKLGQITGADVNLAQQLMQDYMEKNNIPDKKMLVVHQFNHKMISGRDAVRSDFSRVDLIHNADGFGNPAVKLDSYKMNKQATNMPNKGFKLFYRTPLRNWGTDSPLMTPADVLCLDPQPVFIMYQ